MDKNALFLLLKFTAPPQTPPPFCPSFAPLYPTPLYLPLLWSCFLTVRIEFKHHWSSDKYHEMGKVIALAYSLTDQFCCRFELWSVTIRPNVAGEWGESYFFRSRLVTVKVGKWNATCNFLPATSISFALSQTDHITDHIKSVPTVSQTTATEPHRPAGCHLPLQPTERNAVELFDLPQSIIDTINAAAAAARRPHPFSREQIMAVNGVTRCS